MPAVQADAPLNLHTPFRSHLACARFAAAEAAAAPKPAASTGMKLPSAAKSSYMCFFSAKREDLKGGLAGKHAWIGAG